MNDKEKATALELDPCRQDIASQIEMAFRGVWPEFPAIWTAAALAALLEKPPDLKLGDFAFPCFRFAKDLKGKPQEIAQKLSDSLNANSSGWIKSTQVATAFVNISIDKARLSATLLPDICSGVFFSRLKQNSKRQATRVMVEYSQPNTHKEFHVGHARNVAIGGSICQLFRAAGYPTVAVNYYGDEGAHIAKVLWLLKDRINQAPTTAKGEWLATIYVESTRLLAEATPEKKAAMEAEISEILRKVEEKTGPMYDLWRMTRQWSLDDFKEIYQFLGATFDHDFFESEVSEESQRIVDEYLTKGLFVHSDGAVGLELKADKLGFVLLRKRDGNTLYATKDLALARRKFGEFKIDRNIVVVGSEQNLHFRQVFKTLEYMGFPQAKMCHHLSYGMVTVPDGKMSSRLGNSVTFNQLRFAMVEKLHEHLQKYAGEWPPEEITETAKRLCVGAVKYGMLASDPVKDLVFEMDNWLSFEGNTGPYLMYAYTRTQSILRKGHGSGFNPSNLHLAQLAAPEEQDVIRYLFDFNDVILQSCENYRPSILANHLYYMCKEFNRFYTALSVLKAESKELIEARLTLVAAFGETLRYGLGLLGITPPERM